MRPPIQARPGSPYARTCGESTSSPAQRSVATADTASSAAPVLGRRSRWRLGAAAVVIAVAGVLLVRGAARASVLPKELPAHPVVERDGLRYEFNALTGVESLLDLSASPPRELVRHREEELSRMRDLLCRDLRIDGLGRLVDAHREQAEGLRRLGYL